MLRRSVHLYIHDESMSELSIKYLMVSKIFFSAILIAFFISCKSKEVVKEIDYTGFSTKEILLTGFIKHLDDPDTIGRLSIKIPLRLDTFYQWHRTSDCTFCGRLQYRFADNRYNQFAESGFFWTYVPDSVYQFTISHVPIREAPDGIIQTQLSLKDTPLCSHLAYQLTGPDDIISLKKDFREINGRGFIIAEFITPHGLITNDTTLYLTAMTRLKKRNLNFIAECGAKDTTGFIENMYKSLISIKIQEQ